MIEDRDQLALFKFTSLFLLSAHITTRYKEYYKLTQFDQAVYGSTNTKYRVYRKTKLKKKRKDNN